MCPVNLQDVISDGRNKVSSTIPRKAIARCKLCRYPLSLEAADFMPHCDFMQATDLLHSYWLATQQPGCAVSSIVIQLGLFVQADVENDARFHMCYRSASMKILLLLMIHVF